jgi:hypothetical protein
MKNNIPDLGKDVNWLEESLILLEEVELVDGDDNWVDFEALCRSALRSESGG